MLAASKHVLGWSRLGHSGVYGAAVMVVSMGLMPM